MTQLVLLAGATGMLGRRIAHCLTNEPDARLRLMLRPGTMNDAGKAKALAPILERGAEIVFGDLADPASLERAVTGVEVVVSAVQGASAVMIDGQVALAEAARRAGVRRILPSDFALDLFRTPPGEHRLYDMRRQADAGHRRAGPGAYQRAQRRLHGPVRGWGRQDDRSPSCHSAVLGHRGRAVRDHQRRGHRAHDGAGCGGPDPRQRQVRLRSATFSRWRRLSPLWKPRPVAASSVVCWGRWTSCAAPSPRPGGTIRPAWARTSLTYQLFMADGRAGLTNLQTTRYPDIHLAPFAEFAPHGARHRRYPHDESSHPDHRRDRSTGRCHHPRPAPIRPRVGDPCVGARPGQRPSAWADCRGCGGRAG